MPPSKGFRASYTGTYVHTRFSVRMIRLDFRVESDGGTLYGTSDTENAMWLILVERNTVKQCIHDNSVKSVEMKSFRFNA